MLRVPFLSTRRYNVERMALSQITWQDVQHLPDDGHRHEAIEGELYVTPAPSSRHQRVAMRLTLALNRLLVDRGLGELFLAPIGVEFPDTQEGVQPDLVFVSRSRSGIIVEEGVRGAPDLVVEIVSPTTASRDRGVKRKLYERQGVARNRRPAYFATSPAPPQPARTSSARIGSLRTRFPVASNTALATAGMMPGNVISPSPVGGSVLSTKWISISGTSSMRSSG